MKTRAWMLAALLPLAPAAHAADEHPVRQEMDACKQQEQAAGKDKATSAVACAVKVVFQSRVRRKKNEEPVEMTIGSPPMVTDDTDTPGDGNWEINLGLHTESGGGEHRIEAPTIDINKGFGERLQLSFEVPYAFVRTTDDVSGQHRGASGFGDAAFGLKYRFFDDEDSGLSLAIGPQLEFRPPGGSRLVSENATAFVLPLMLTKEFEHTSIGANLGAEFSAGEQRLFASLGAGWRLTDRTAMLAELAGTDLNAADEKRVALNVGLRHKISEAHSISGSIGRDVFAGGDQARQTYFTVAWQIDIGK